MESNRPRSAPLVAARGSTQKEQTAMPRWFTRNDSWDFGGKPDPQEAQAGEPKRRKRRLATTFVFTTLFFAGAPGDRRVGCTGDHRVGDAERRVGRARGSGS